MNNCIMKNEDNSLGLSLESLSEEVREKIHSLVKKRILPQPY